MKLLIDLNNKSEIGPIEWEFVHDMQTIIPKLITPELILLTEDFLDVIPAKWKTIKQMLEKHVSHENIVYCAMSDTENLGNDFQVKGILKNKNEDPLDFHKVVIFDKDKFEDDYIGTVITNKKGQFSLYFGKKTFSDFGIEQEPDIYFRVYYLKGGKFANLGKITPDRCDKTITKERRFIYDFGDVFLSS